MDWKYRVELDKESKSIFEELEKVKKISLTLNQPNLVKEKLLKEFK